MSAGILMKIVLLRKEDLPSEGRVIEQIYALARIFYIYFPINTKNVCFVVILLSYPCCIHIVAYIDVVYSKTACTGPESFARGGPSFFYKGKEDPNSIKSGPLSARQRNSHLVLPRVAIGLSKGRYDETFAGEDAKLHLNGVSLAGR